MKLVGIVASANAFDFTTFFWLIVIASVVAMVGRYVKIPYALALVITGLIVGPSHILPQVHLDPHILFTIFLPPLLFESAIHMRASLLRDNWKAVTIYALVGTLVSTFIVGFLVSWLLKIPILPALVFGALISPTDPISVISIFKQLGVGKRLSLMIEAESLFNDGVAIVLFSLLVNLALGGSVSLVSSIESFFLVVLGGAVIGGLIGFFASRLTREFDDHLLEITMTTIVAFGSYLAAESAGVSGVIAVVTAGLFMGSYGMRTGMSPTTRLSVSSFWEYAAFVVNSIVFLLVGFEVTVVHLTAAVPAILGAVVAVLIGRALAIYGLSPLINKMHGDVPMAWQHVFFWGGLRGAIPMALVIGLGRDFPGRDELVVLTFGVVLISLLVQGMTLKTLMKRIGLSSQQNIFSEFRRLSSEILSSEGALRELKNLHEIKAISSSTCEQLSDEYRARIKDLEKSLDKLTAHNDDLLQAQENEARVVALKAEKSALKESVLNGLLDEGDFEKLTERIDSKLENLQGID